MAQLRHATVDDLPVIVAIYNSTVPSRLVTADLDPVSVESRRAWFDAHTPDSSPLWVLEERGQVIAWMSFQPFYGRPAYRATAEISLYVDASHRRAGWGQWLLTRAIDEAPRCGLQTLLGFIFAHNEPSLRLFERLGFQSWGHLPRVAVLDGVERDLVIVGRRVDAAR